VPGWFVVAPARHVEKIEELGSAELTALGPLLAEVAAALRRETPCEKVYVSVFAEVLPHLHVHVIARPPGLPAEERGSLLFVAQERAAGAEVEALALRVLARLAAPGVGGRARSTPLRAALLSGLLCPGAGQIKNGDHLKGILLIGGTLITAGVLFVRLLTEVLRSVPEDPTAFDPLQVFALAEEIQRRNAGSFLLITLILVALWVFAVVDAYVRAARLQR
jgi:diadenosine tetraphosphate (Ap4A) HIT family hydrolase